MRDRRREIARETLAIVDRGGYVAPSGAAVRIAPAVQRAVAGTRLYLPDDPLPAPAGATGNGPGRIEVTGETTLAAARRLAAAGAVAALNFASARNPGGGFLGGAQAQEESLARSSALYACLTAVPDYYRHHRRSPDPRYTDRVVHSPRVPVFRDDDGRLLDAVHEVSFLTAAAPNRGAVLANRPELAPDVPAVLDRRARRVLAVAAAHGHRRLVLGAWGCGVFRNDPAVVAAAFGRALAAAAGCFDHVAFAVLDAAPGAPTRTAFADAFGAA